MSNYFMTISKLQLIVNLTEAVYLLNQDMCSCVLMIGLWLYLNISFIIYWKLETFEMSQLVT